MLGTRTEAETSIPAASTILFAKFLNGLRAVSPLKCDIECDNQPSRSVTGIPAAKDSRIRGFLTTTCSSW